jgi:DNA gyrase subunit A
LPFLLLNGSSGIAVGMATNIPPHNLGEVIDGLIALIDNPQLSDEQLLTLIPGPDFPTGGEIIDTEGVREAYLTGRGSIPVRGIAQFEEIQPGRGRHRRLAIVVTELPYQVNKAAWIEKIADLVNHTRIEGIQDIRDESDREGMRVVIELKREVNPQRILNQLYKLTPLQSNFGAIMLALADGQPRQMTLRELLQHFLQFREATLTRQYRYELERAEHRIHILEGLLGALENLDAIIDILRNAPDGSTAKAIFQEEFEFSDRQSDAILAMPLRRLTGLERQNLQTEFEELNQRRQELQLLLTNHKEFLKALKKDLRTLKRKFTDPRRTRIQTPEERQQESTALAEAIAKEAAIEEEVILEFTQRGYVRRSTPKAFQRQQERQETPEQPTLAENDDVILQIESASTQQDLLILTRSGKAYTAPVSHIAQTHRTSKGTPLITLLPQTAQADPEIIAAQFPLPLDLEGLDLIMLTQQGRIKRVPLTEFTNMTGRGLTALKLKDDDALTYAVISRPGEQLVIASSGGRMLRFEVDDEQLPITSRTAQGQPAQRISKQEHLVGCASLNEDEHFLVVSTQGYAKCMPMSALRLAHRGELGIQAMQFANKTDSLAGIIPAIPGTDIVVLTSSDRSARIAVDDLNVWGKDGTGDRILKPNRGEKITALAIASLIEITIEGEEEQEESEE